MSRSKCKSLRSEILDGSLLAIDPSSGSVNRFTGEQSSLGWAIFKEGNLQGSGTIEVIKSESKEDRLRDLVGILHTRFDTTFDALVLENIPAVSCRKNGFSVDTTLIQACGVVVAGTTGALVEMNIHTWQAVARRLGGWTKGDESDAIYLGLSAIAFAVGYDQKFTEKVKTTFLGDLVDHYDGWNMKPLLDFWGMEELEDGTS